MRCVACKAEPSIVKDSRLNTGTNTIRRRRRCDACGERWTTFEVCVQGEIHFTPGMVLVSLPNGELAPIASVAHLEDTLAKLEAATASIRDGLLGLGSAPPAHRPAPWPARPSFDDLERTVFDR